MVSRRLRRYWLLLSAALVALAAVLAPHWSGLSLQPESLAAQSFSSALVPKTVPLAALQSAVGEPRFQALVGGEVSLEPAPDDHFRLVAHHPKAETAQARVKQSVALLSAELERLALAEVEANREHLAKLKNDVSKRMKTRASAAESDQALVTLPEKDAKRILKLRREVAALKTYIEGGKRPGWLSPVLERGSLERQEKKVQAAKNELARLSDLWAPSSKAVQAQTKLVQREKAELASLERHLAGVLLDAHRIELKGLEEKSHSLVRQNSDASAAESSADAEPTPPPGLTESAVWLQQKSQELASQAAKIEKLAALSPDGEIVIEPAQPWGRWLVAGLWITCLGLLLAALSQPDHPAARRARAQSAKPSAPVPPKPEGSPRPIAIAPDELFHQILHRLERELGRPPQRLLILAVDGTERSGFTLRLARSVSNLGQSVKLLDFDFLRQELSKRIHGAPPQPGVSDLLTYGGAAEEFFASFPETRIQFAPAGTVSRLADDVNTDLVDRLLTHQAPRGITLIDADFTSPIHVVAPKLCAVLLLSLQGHTLNKTQEEVLLALRQSRLPIWGVAQASSSVFPYL